MPTPQDRARQPATVARIAESVAAMLSGPGELERGRLDARAHEENGTPIEDLFSADRDKNDPRKASSWSLPGAIRLQCAEHLGIDLSDTGQSADAICDIYCIHAGVERQHGPEGALNALIFWEEDLLEDDRNRYRFDEIVDLAGHVARSARRSADELARGAGWISFHSEPPEAIRAWLDRGGQVDRRDMIGDTPLHRAAGNFPAVQVLLEAGADPNARNNGFATPLAFASGTGNAASIAAMLVAGADVNARDRGECAALHRAANAECVAILLAAGAQIAAADRSGYTALHAATYCDRTDIVWALIDAGADVHAADTYGWTPLHTAAIAGSTGVVKVLLEVGAAVDGRAPSVKGREATPLHNAASEGHADTVRVLLNAGASTAVLDEFGDTPLETAKACGHDHVVVLLEKAVSNSLPEPAQ